MLKSQIKYGEYIPRWIFDYKEEYTALTTNFDLPNNWWVFVNENNKLELSLDEPFEFESKPIGDYL